MMEIREPAASDAPPAAPSASAPLGDDLHLSLDCPECGTSGWVRWASLKRGMACPKCGCHFHVARNGQLRSDQNLPQVRFHCPRCHQAGVIPAIFRVRKARCGVCKLPLEAGPDDKLHGAKEAAQMRRATAAASLAATATPGKFEQFFFDPNGKMRITNFVVVGIVAVGLIAAIVTGAGALLASTPEGEVRAFTYECLAGDWNSAEEFLPANDDVARIEFQRWRGFYFTSILDKHRPAGDKVRITVVREGEDPASSIFVVTMKSPVIGQREIREHWRTIDGRWRFDVVKTLAAMN